MRAETDARSAGSALTVREFFEEVRAGRLTIQRCVTCGALAVPPKVICPACEGTTWNRAALGGDGEVTSFTVIRVPPGRLVAEAPYAIVIVGMREGVSLLGRVVDVALDALRVGLPVRFAPPDDATADPPVLRFRPR